MEDCAVRRKKVLLGITLSEMGGAQKVVYEIISSLNEQKYDITLVTSPRGELVSWVNELNQNRQLKIRVILLPHLKRNISLTKDLRTFINLYIILKKGKYDIAHFHSSKMGVLGRLSAWVAGVPKIFFTVHGWGINEHQSFLKRLILGRMERIAGKACNKVISVSQYDKERGINKGWINRGKITVVHNGVDHAPKVKGKLSKLISINEDVVTIGSIARLQQPKDPIFTIRVFNEIKKRGYNAKLILIGDGVLMDECNKIINFLGLNNDVYLLGTREDARELLNDIDILTLFSNSEGLPLSIIEGMLASKPIVASKVGGISELVTHKKNGYLLDKSDLNLGAKYIEELLKNKKSRLDMGLLGKKKAINQFSKEKMIKDYENIYSE